MPINLPQREAIHDQHTAAIRDMKWMHPVIDTLALFGLLRAFLRHGWRPVVKTIDLLAKQQRVANLLSDCRRDDQTSDRQILPVRFAVARGVLGTLLTVFGDGPDDEPTAATIELTPAEVSVLADELNQTVQTD